MNKFDETINDYQLDAVVNKPVASVIKRSQIAQVAYIRLATPLGSYFADPRLGSRLYLLKRSKDLPRVRRQAVQWAKEALDAMRDDFHLTGIDAYAVDVAHTIHKSRFAIRAVLTAADGSQHQTYINVAVAG